MRQLLLTPIILAMAFRAGYAEESAEPILKPLIISGHRAGGRVFAPDNSAPNIQHAAVVGLNLIEIDLRPTADGGLVLWHDSSSPRSTFFPGDTFGKRIVFNRMSVSEIGELRYAAAAGEREWKDLAIVDADTMIEQYKNRLNFHLDVKNTLADRVLKLIADHGIRDRVIVMSPNLDYIRTIKKADQKIICEWTNNTLGRHNVDGKWVYYPTDRQHAEYYRAMQSLRKAGGDMLCTKGLTTEKARICHQYGIAVRPSANNVKTGDGARFLHIGVDGILGDDPCAVTEAVRKIRGKDYVPLPGQTVAEIFASRRVRLKERPSRQ